MLESPVNLKAAVGRRRTFAIISHPDAGKTTLTEKLLLYGGAIQEAGAVKNRRAERAATSDWMALEQQRGISITSTVLQFEYRDYHLNLLDTPGHHDFSEDTYRTLTAADNAVMLVDAAKGLETQTRKLFAVCRMRDIPVFTFINKLDRPSRDALELLDEIEKELKLNVYAVNWAIGSGETFRGIYNRLTGNVHLYERNPRGRQQARETIIPLADAKVKEIIGDNALLQLLGDLEILDGAGAMLDKDAVLRGETSPVFFGSAMTNFGIEPFLDAFLNLSAAPVSHQSSIGEIKPTDPEFSGFVFKLQANMDLRHRDCLAFVRVCSGQFTKDMTVTNARTGKKVRLTRPQKVFARERESMDEAFPGDVVGLNNPGAFAIGDTIYTGQKLVYPQIPSFTPELFARIRNPNTSLAKKFQKGIAQLEEEGAIQILHRKYGGASQEPILAAVGELQFEVAQYRLRAEYGVETRLESLSYTSARWVTAGWDVLMNGQSLYETDVYQDRWERPVLLFRSPWHLERVEQERPELKLSPVGTF
ncbi:MAG: peptide chain release factor 3 [Acidobacteriota bacterium]|nr:peptide chain release factor 3 [Acidobacteriota bacterium]